jgi:hypothetical protein
MYSDNLVIALNNIATEYRGKLEAAIKAVLSQARYTNTGRGVQSVAVSVVPGTTNASPALVVTLDDYVLLLDRSKLQWTKLPNVKNLLEWARARKSDEKEAKKLAWAVAWDKKKNDTWKPKKWRKKGLGETLREMNAEMLLAFDAAIGNDFQRGIDRQLKAA